MPKSISLTIAGCAGNLCYPGQITPAEIEEITGGLMRQAVDVRLNKMVFDYDQFTICGPTFSVMRWLAFPVVTNIFPGIGGDEVINFSHWLGAVITSYDVIGTASFTRCGGSSTKRLPLLTSPNCALVMVVMGEDGAGLYIGTPEEFMRPRADLSAKPHVTWIDRPYQRVLLVMPRMYDDIWMALGGMYTRWNRPSLPEVKWLSMLRTLTKSATRTATSWMRWALSCGTTS
ncbi:MAG: hypothetical protein U0401_21720 [Anaerolineae bacterium]